MSTKELTARIKSRSFPRIWLSPFVKAVFAALFSAIMSRLTLFGTSSPFGVAAALSFPTNQLFISCLGAIWGYCSGFTAFSVKYTVAVFLGGLTRLVLSKLKRLSSSAASAISAGLPLFICCMVTFTEAPSSEGILLGIGEALLAGGSSFIISSAIPFIQNPFSRLGISKRDNAAFIITFSLLLSSFAQFEVFGYSFGRIFCVYFILMGGICGNESFFSVFGIVCGTAIAFCSTELMFTALMYPLCALLCGLFSGGRKLTAIAAYFLGCGLTVIYTGISDTVLAVICETLIAAALFIITPQSLSGIISSFFFISAGKANIGLSKRLDNTSAGLLEVASAIRKVGKNLDNINSQDITTIFDHTSDCVCGRCGLKNICWVEHYDETLDKLSDIIPILKNHGRIVAADLPSGFRDKCAKPNEITAAINRYYSSYDAKAHLNSHTSNMRKRLADQFEALSDVFNEIKSDYAENEYNDFTIASRVRTMFENEHLDITDCRCLIAKQGYMRLEVDFICDDDICINKENLDDRLFDICGRHFEPPAVDSFENIRRITIREKVNFKAEFSAVCLAAGNNKLCGDSYDYLLSDDGRAIAIISDGMGSGGLAALESKMAVSLLSKLIKYGFSYESALSVVNWALMVKSDDEMLTTLDMLSVDLYSGEGRILKAGAPSSFIRRGENVQEIEFASSPIGILKNASFESSKVKLAEGDLAVLVSDGAVMGDSSWLKHEISLFNGDLDCFVKNLAKKAKARRPTGQEDDVTVMAVILKSA